MAPLAIVFIGIVLPLWLLSLVIVGATWCLIAPLEMVVRIAGGSWMRPVRARVERMMHVLTHPQIPDRWRKR